MGIYIRECEVVGRLVKQFDFVGDLVAIVDDPDPPLAAASCKHHRVLQVSIRRLLDPE